MRPLALGLVLLLLDFGRAATPAAQNRPYVYATAYPLAYFAARISDGSLLVLYPEIRGAPSSWRPSAAQRDDMRAAELVFLNGAGYERWDASGIVAPERLVVTTAGLDARPRLAAETGALRLWPRLPSEDRSSGVTWLDLSLAIGQAAAIKEALLRAQLGERRALELNFAELEDELALLDQTLLRAANPDEPAPIVAATPAYAYLARRYPFHLTSLDWTGKGIPSEAMMLELEALLGEHPARLMLWPEMPDWPMRQRLQDLGLAVVVLSPLERWPASGDFLSVMRENVERLKEALEAAE